MIGAKEAADLLDEKHGDTVDKFVKEFLSQAERIMYREINKGKDSAFIVVEPDTLNVYVSNHIREVVINILRNKGFLIDEDESFGPNTVQIKWNWNSHRNKMYDDILENIVRPPIEIKGSEK